MQDPVGASTARASIDASPTLRVPLFQALVAGFDAERRRVVLDLGTARSPTIALFARFRCRIEIADVADGLDGLNAAPDAQALAAAVRRLLPPATPELFDAVLCWDLLNYVDRRALAALMAAIAERARPGARVHGLIAYRETSMPLKPGMYVPIDDQSLVNASLAAGQRAAPRYSPEDLSLAMPAYTIDRGRLLSNGMQEFLFRVRGDEPSEPRRAAPPLRTAEPRAGTVPVRR